MEIGERGLEQQFRPFKAKFLHRVCHLPTTDGVQVNQLCEIVQFFSGTSVCVGWKHARQSQCMFVQNPQSQCTFVQNPQSQCTFVQNHKVNVRLFRTHKVNVCLFRTHKVNVRLSKIDFLYTLCCSQHQSSGTALKKHSVR